MAAASLSADPEQPRLWLRWLGTLALLVCLALLALHAFANTGARLPPALLGLGLAGTLGAVAANFAVGHLLFLLGLGVQLAFYWGHPTQLPAELALRANLLSLTCATQLFVVGYGRTVRLLGRRIRAQQLRIEHRLSERAELTRSLNLDLGRSMEALRAELAAHQPALPALSAAQNQLQQVIERARRTLDIRHERVLAVDTVLPDFRRRMTRILLGASLCNVSLAIVRVTLTGKGPPLPTWIVLGFTVAALIGSEWRPRLRPYLIGVLTGASLLAIVAAGFYWGFEEPPPNVLFLVTLAYNGFLIEARRAPWIVLMISLMLQAALVYLGVCTDAWSVALMACTALWTALHQLGWYALEQRVFSALRLAQERAGELALLDAFRARISGTLFHDVANPVQVTRLQGPPGGSPRPGHIPRRSPTREALTRGSRAPDRSHSYMSS